MNQYSIDQALVLILALSWGFYYTKSLNSILVRGWYNYSYYTGDTVNTTIGKSVPLFLPLYLILRIAMKNFTNRVLVLIFLLIICDKSLNAQSVLNPADS